MSRARTFLASFALASSLLACAVPHAEAQSAKPAAMKIAPVKATLREQVRTKLVERRKLTMQRFLAYRNARVYPVNSKIPGAAHVWLDENGNLCAAATIIAQDWGRGASEAVAKEDNNIALASLTEGELYNWILTSGMTQAEIVAIQAPGFAGGPMVPEMTEADRLFALYTDVERQIRSLDKHNLDLAVDALMKHPDLARDLVDGKIASAGHFKQPARTVLGFAKPPAN